MRRCCCLCLLLLSMIGTAYGDVSSITTAYTFDPPQDTEYSAYTWRLTMEKYSQEKAKEALQYFAPDVHVEADSGYLMYCIGNYPVTMSTLDYHSDRVAPLRTQEPLLNFLGWTNTCEMTSIRADEYFQYWDISGFHADYTFDLFLERKGFPQDAASASHVLWQTIDGRLVYPAAIIPNGDPYELYAELVCDGKNNFTSAQFCRHILDAAPIEAVTTSISPMEAAEKVTQGQVERWRQNHGVTGTVYITVDKVTQGYWVDDDKTAHPGWLIHVWDIRMNDKGERAYVWNQWMAVDFADGMLL